MSQIHAVGAARRYNYTQPPPPPPPPAAPAPGAPGAPPEAPAPGTPGGPDMTPEQVATTYQPQIEAASNDTGVPKSILAGMIWQESKGNASVQGGGLMQIGPNEFQMYGGDDINDPADNIMAGARYMADLIQQFDGSIPLALRAYNSGPNGVDRNDPSATPAGTGDPTYVDKVLDAA